MPRLGASPFSFPDFRGTTRLLVLVNLITFFVLLVAGMAMPQGTNDFIRALSFRPDLFLQGAIWQPFTYSLIHVSLVATLLELLSLWFLAGFLENLHTSSWLLGLFGASVLGTAAAALAIYALSAPFHFSTLQVPLYGCFGGIFGLLIAIGVLYGDMEFLLFFTIGIKARYLAALYALISIAMLFGEQRVYAFSQLGGALAGLLFIQYAPRRGVSFAFSEKWFGMRNRYYRWKRRRAARKFEVYMRSQGRTIRFDGQGKQLDEDHDDKKRWN